MIRANQIGSTSLDLQEVAFRVKPFGKKYNTVVLTREAKEIKRTALFMAWGLGILMSPARLESVKKSITPYTRRSAHG